ncbi:hypothetical protein KFK09_018329 [Dendrobium nobile]|uniref:Uncharacterized protein n=1 Tax=Dendrobium nobile TaxID=94219 RepID=A0A8T3AVG6_DENNO|nr:hypothetical protein KFK09_018329 [Dendrobium nobile]
MAYFVSSLGTIVKELSSPGGGSYRLIINIFHFTMMRPIFCGNVEYDARQSEIERLSADMEGLIE